MKKTKLFRSLMLLIIACLTLVTGQAANRTVLLILSGLYCLLILLLLFGLTSSREHIFDNPALILLELLLMTGMTAFTNPFLLLPFLGLQTVELVLENRRIWVINTFLGLILLSMTAGSLMRGAFREMLFFPPLISAVAILVKMIHIQEDRSRSKYEYMKNLVDNKNKLLSTLTHELRTPLAVIKTSNELIMEERPGPLNPTQKALISSSLENTERLNSLVENILSQVKVEFAWFSMKRQPLDIRNIIRKVALDIKPFLESRGQQVKYSYPSLLSKTLGDRRWLEQVLLNLIHNGSKNSNEDSVISITVQENEQCIVVSVHDNGSGIETQEIPHVFNEFYQSSDPARNRNDGAGLGLTIVKDIIRKHQGEVYISSLPRNGTTVSFTLPRYKGVFSGTNHSDH